MLSIDARYLGDSSPCSNTATAAQPEDHTGTRWQGVKRRPAAAPKFCNLTTSRTTQLRSLQHECKLDQAPACKAIQPLYINGELTARRMNAQTRHTLPYTTASKTLVNDSGLRSSSEQASSLAQRARRRFPQTDIWLHWQGRPSHTSVCSLEERADDLGKRSAPD